jgi:hypothetical protein
MATNPPHAARSAAHQERNVSLYSTSDLVTRARCSPPLGLSVRVRIAAQHRTR